MTSFRSRSFPRRTAIWSMAICLAGSIAGPSETRGALAGQNPDNAGPSVEEALGHADSPSPPSTAPPKSASSSFDSFNLLRLLSPSLQGGGGPFMIPMYIMSFAVVLFGIERSLALRRRKQIPPEFVAALGNLSSSPGGFDPRKAYKLCQRFPSTAANVVRAVLLKTGRPHGELEDAVVKANEREAEHLYSNIRPLNLAATVAPLIGLLGTVQGMIVCFYATAHLPEGASRAQQLAEGIYVKLICTFAGLCVAIPAVTLAHFFEGKIQRLFRETDDLVYNLLPQLERFEGKLRVSRMQTGNDAQEPVVADPLLQPVRVGE